MLQALLEDQADERVQLTRSELCDRINRLFASDWKDLTTWEDLTTWDDLIQAPEWRCMLCEQSVLSVDQIAHIAVLPCHHVAHLNHLKTYFKRHQVCPTCGMSFRM